ncbi:MAG: WG repeat-containing protein [Bacteroidia bacterium]|nr:WG repeat-containing protein [Bacteroidia bacterium]
MKKLLSYTIFLLIFACSETTIRNKPNGLFPIKEFGKWGYINSNGEIAIKCQFEKAGQFSEGLAPILLDTVWGFIDTTGKIVIEPKYFEVNEFSDGLCMVTIKKNKSFQYAFIKTDGTIAFFTPHNNISRFAYGRATVKINGEVCVIDSKGKIVFNTHYPYGGGSSFHDGIVQVWGGKGEMVQEGLSSFWRGDTTRYYDTSGNIIAEFPSMGHGKFSEGLAKIHVNNQTFYIDKTGKTKVSPQNADMDFSSFSDGLAQITFPFPNYEKGFIDTTGKLVTPLLNLPVIEEFKEGLAAYEVNEGWGFMNKEGKIAIKPQFERIEYGGFSNGLCRVKQNHQWGYINYKGDFVWKEQFGFEYTKIDLSKWDLDTLEINQPLTAHKYAGPDNYPRKRNSPDVNSITLKIDTTDLTVFADKYFAFKLYFINGTKNTIQVPVQDGIIEIIQQAKNRNGEWQDIENFIYSFCGNSYFTLPLGSNEFQIFPTPIFKGNYKTQLRFILLIDKQIIVSNEYSGHINYGQFLQPKDKDKIGVMIWTN